jgi:RHS repeat-associated protein
MESRTVLRNHAAWASGKAMLAAAARVGAVFLFLSFATIVEAQSIGNGGAWYMYSGFELDTADNQCFIEPVFVTFSGDVNSFESSILAQANSCLTQLRNSFQAYIASCSGGVTDLEPIPPLGPLPSVEQGVSANANVSGSAGCNSPQGTALVEFNVGVEAWVCPAGQFPFDTGQAFEGGGCGPAPLVYYIEAPPPPLAQTSSNDSVGEPINPGVGNVYTTETDVKFAAAGAIAFRRYYNSADVSGVDNVPGWRHSYSRSISTVYQTPSSIYPGQSPSVSAQFATPAAACTTGFAAIQSAVSSWAGATATYNNGVCVLSNGSITIGTLPIQSTSASIPPVAPVEYDVIRDDGQTLRYTLQNGVINNPLDISVRLATTASGFTVTDDQDNVESYNASGVLQSITSRAGVVQTVSYDNSGLFSGVTDSFGNSLTVTRNAQSNIVSIVSSGGGTVQYGYSTNNSPAPTGSVTNLLTTVTNLDGTTRRYVYGNTNFPNALTAEVDENGTNFASWTYDSQERGISSQFAGGANATSLVYNADGSVTVTDALGAKRTFQYSRTGDINRVSAIGGSQCSTCEDSAATTYDSAGYVSSRTDYNGNLTCYANDPIRGLQLVRVEGFAPGSACPANLASYTPAAGTLQRMITTQWNPNFREPALITEPNRTTAFTFDGSGNILTKTITDTTPTPSPARTWTYTYNGFGQVLTIDGPRTDVSDVTTMTYYTCTTGGQCGQINTITNALGQVTTFNTYNAYGQPLTITDPNGVLTTLSYDARQRLTSSKTATETTSFAYYPTGLMRTLSQPDSSNIQFTYDGAHRLTQVSDGAGNSIKYTLDALGNHTAESAFDPSNTLSRTQSRVYNTLGELSQIIGAAGTAAVTTTLGFDNNGNLTSRNSPLSRHTANQFDVLNRLTQITDPATGVTQLSYDSNNKVVSVTDPQNLTTSYGHDGFGNLTQRASPDSGTITNAYDSGGNLKTTTDARGAVTTYTYDALNRLISAAYQTGGTTDQTITYSFDTGANGKGRLTGASDANHSMSWTYDALGRVTGKGQTVGGVTKSVGYAYVNGDPTTLTTPSGQTVTYNYANHQITGITVNSTAVLTSANYEPFGPVRGWTWGNGTTEIRLHNTDGNPSVISGIESVSLGYDNAFRIISTSNSSNSTLSWTYGYDPLDRLTSASESGTTLGWSYDSNGNRTQQTGAPAATALSGAGASFTYSGRGRMNSVTAGGTTTNYVYNALGQMIEKNVGGSVTFLMYDEAGHLIGEYSGSGSLIQETVWIGNIPVATLRPNGSGISVYYVHANQLGAPIMVTRSADNAVVWRWDTDPFGTEAPNQNPQSLGTFSYNLRFPGQYYQAETGLNYNYFRDYDPHVGREIESDPIGLAGRSYSTYAYAGGNPVNFADPTGQCPWCAAAFVGAVIGAYSGYISGLQNGETPGEALVDGAAGAAAGATAGLVASEAGTVAIGAGAAAAATALVGVINGNGSLADVAVAAVAGATGAYVAVTLAAEGVAGAIVSGALTGEIQSVVTGAIHSGDLPEPTPSPQSCH